MENKIKFAVLGCGHIGKRHAEMVMRNAEAELVAMCDIRPKGEVGIEAFNVPYFSSIDELLNSCGYDESQSIIDFNKFVYLINEDIKNNIPPNAAFLIERFYETVVCG